MQGAIPGETTKETSLALCSSYLPNRCLVELFASSNVETPRDFVLCTTKFHSASKTETSINAQDVPIVIHSPYTIKIYFEDNRNWLIQYFKPPLAIVHDHFIVEIDQDYLQVPSLRPDLHINFQDSLPAMKTAA